MKTLFVPPEVTELDWVGEGLQRPECVLATASGDIYTADWRGGVAHRHPDGRQSLYLGRTPEGADLRPNGIALLRDGSFLLAQLGAQDGGVYQLQRDGRTTPWLMAVDGQPLPPTNFVLEGPDGGFWVTVSTRRQPRSLGYRPGPGDGFIVRVDCQGARIVADGLGYANEVAVHPNGRWLYVNETFGRRLSRFALLPGGALGARETVVEFGAGTFPDGLAFDEDGGCWVVSIVSNRLLRVSPDGAVQTWLEDNEPGHLAWVEEAFANGGMDRPHLDTLRSRALRNISSIAFTGPERRHALLGCLLGERLARITLPSPGVKPVHWHYPNPTPQPTISTESAA